ncbi:MAG: ZIP family metal transporter [Candidatus Nanohaloarchaea archaeon]|nr:ZIP family metal transporter [Candidatus Nanohaloarchaea archaeon]
MNLLLWGSLVVVSLFSALGALLLFLSEPSYERLSPYLLSLAAGTMFGGVFIHLIFRLANTYSYGRGSGLLVVIGILASLGLERLVHWHCHHTQCRQQPLPYILAAGDALHNIIDGVLIATSFLASTTAGLSAVIAVIAHKIPKEFGDFGVMVRFGFSETKAIATNITISLLMFIGAGIVVLAAQRTAGIVPFLLPLVIGNFIYVAGSDLLPTFKEDENWHRHTLVFSLGVAIMYSLPYIRQALL